jgi:hypothetical protein
MPNSCDVAGFKNERWPWVRAVLAFCVVVLATLVWNPRFTIAGLWNSWERGGYVDNKNALSVLAIGLAVVGCLESLRKRVR